jgi:O-6-methylguanine DNA methyltransferase
MNTAKTTEIYTDHISLPIGEVHVSASDKGMTGLYFMSDTNNVEAIEGKIKRNIKNAKIIKNSAITAPYCKAIKELWAQKNPAPTQVNFDLHGTDFQKSIWQSLLTIQSGETLTYSQLAAKAGKPKAIRAAASAVAKNPISILIPCHRILPKSGGVGHYGGGSHIKKSLLEHEDAI